LKCCIEGKNLKSRLQEAIFGRIPPDDPQEGSSAVKKLTGCVIWIEESKP
jgi:hypothetical protein